MPFVKSHQFNKIYCNVKLNETCKVISLETTKNNREKIIVQK